MNGRKKKFDLKGFLMHLGCILPLIIIVFWPFFKNNSGQIVAYLPYLLILLCPLSHLLMMGMFNHKGQEEDENKS